MQCRSRVHQLIYTNLITTSGLMDSYRAPCQKILCQGQVLEKYKEEDARSTAELQELPETLDKFERLQSRKRMRKKLCVVTAPYMLSYQPPLEYHHYTTGRRLTIAHLVVICYTSQ
jgi:hypothetical protein